MKIWKTIGVTTQGSANKENSIECQDVVASYEKNGLTVIALADGAGTREYALEGAQIVAPAVAKFVALNFTKLFSGEELEAKKAILDDLIQRVSKRAKKYNCSIDEFASTILFVAIKEDKQYITGQIGDGLICCLNDSGWNVISREENKGSLQNINLVTSTNVYAVMKMQRFEMNTETSFAILSDGAEKLYSNNDAYTEVSSMSDSIVINKDEVAQEIISSNVIEKSLNSESDCGIIFAAKKRITCIYDNLDYEEKQEIFEKHYSHLYNVEAAIEDASFIVKVLKTTNANAAYISKKSKVKLSNCKKITEILAKANYLNVSDDIYSLVQKED